MDTALDTLLTALYVKIDDMLVKEPRPGHPARLSQSELVCLAVAQALLGFHSEHRWIRFALCHLRGAFPCLPHQPGYNKRLRAALPLVKQVIRDLAADSDFWSGHRMGRRLHSGGMRPLAASCQALGPGRLGRLRVLREPFPLVLGAAAVPDHHPGRDAGPVGAGRPEDRRA